MSKKRSKKHFESIVSSVLATSILSSSCTYYHSEDVYDRYEPTRNIGDALLPISIKIKPDDARYIKALQKLSIDILNNPEIANEALNNPLTVLNKYGYNGDIRLDDTITKIILALGNKEINDAIKNKNMNDFVALCKKYNLIADQNKSEFLSNKYYQEQLTKYKEYTQTRVQADETAAELFFVAGAIAIAVVAVVVVAGVGAAWNVIAGYNSFVRVNRMASREEAQQLSVIDIVPMKTENGYQLVDEYYEEAVSSAVEFIKIEHPEVLKVNSEDELRQFIYANIIQNINN